MMESGSPDTQAPRTGNGHDADGTRSLPDPMAALAEAEAIVRDTVQTYPLLSLAGALFGGYAIARLLRRVR